MAGHAPQIAQDREMRFEAFRKRCTTWCRRSNITSVGAHDNETSWAYITCEELLDKEVEDATAKRFFKTWRI